MQNKSNTSWTGCTKINSTHKDTLYAQGVAKKTARLHNTKLKLTVWLYMGAGRVLLCGLCGTKPLSFSSFGSIANVATHIVAYAN